MPYIIACRFNYRKLYNTLLQYCLLGSIAGHESAESTSTRHVGRIPANEPSRQRTSFIFRNLIHTLPNYASTFPDEGLTTSVYMDDSHPPNPISLYCFSKEHVPWVILQSRSWSQFAAIWVTARRTKSFLRSEIFFPVLQSQIWRFWEDESAIGRVGGCVGRWSFP